MLIKFTFPHSWLVFVGLTVCVSNVTSDRYKLCSAKHLWLNFGSSWYNFAADLISNLITEGWKMLVIRRTFCCSIWWTFCCSIWRGEVHQFQRQSAAGDLELFSRHRVCIGNQICLHFRWLRDHNLHNFISISNVISEAIRLVTYLAGNTS